LWVELLAELAEEGVEVVGRGGEVEEWGGICDETLYIGVEFRHTLNRGGFGDEGRAQDTDGVASLCYFDSIVDICIPVSRRKLTVEYQPYQI
jgi:hypothetical protein